ncbi:Sodium/potassium/calcium exchanger 3 [Lamellibrachia satsuma]|nr:Sodium/potassium/calcium exchanger 3 [Lamellibrachia satsuma]
MRPRLPARLSSRRVHEGEQSRISETTSNTDNNNHLLAFLFTTVGSRIALRSKRSIADGAVEWYEALLMLLLYVAYIGVMWFNTPLQKWAVARIHIFGVRPDDVKQILSPTDDRKCYQTYEMFPQENGTKPGEQTPDVFSSHETRRVSFEDACFRIMKGKEFKSKTRFKSAAYIILLERREMMQRRRPKTFSLDSDSTSYMKAVRGSTAIQDEFDSAADWKQLPLFDDGICHLFRWVALLPIKIVLYYTVPNCREPRWQGWFMVTFVNSIVWIAIFSYLMVWMVAVIGFTFGIPDSIMGITFLAAGTSVPDAMASVMVARQGQGDMAVSNTIGSNVFDILIGLALPWFIQTALVSAGSTVAINSNGLVFSVVLLFLTVILTISAVHFGGWRLDRRLGIVCLLSYSVFLFFSIMIEFNVFGYVNAPMCVESG